jgi:hypothetical protein
LALQVWPEGHVPHLPPLPQPSSPHSRPAQFGAQHSATPLVVLHWLAGGWQQVPAQHPVAPGGQACPPQSGPLAAQACWKQLAEQQSLFCWQGAFSAAQLSSGAQTSLAQWVEQQ